MPELKYVISASDDGSLERALKKANEAALNVGNTIGNTAKSNEQSFTRLEKAIAGAFTIHAVKDFVSELISVRGEFQQIENALETITGSQETANNLMAQWKDLTLRSPFRLSELAASGKQLLAYGINVQNVTHDIEMLANIAAGTSQPISELAYLYGTLRTQGRAYAMDIRQFTGRGINLIPQLAKQFKVAQDEVMGLVEAGKVGFPEVEKALNQLTSAGGQFNNLIGKQAETLTGQINRLKHEIELMFNEMGEDSESFLSDAIGGVAVLVEHYKEVGKALAVIIATYGAYKAAVAVDTAIAATIAAQTTAINAETVAKNANTQATLANMRAEVAAAATNKNAAIQEAVRAQASLVAARANLAALSQTTNARKIKVATDAVDAAQEEAKIARQAALAASSDFYTKKLALETAATSSTIVAETRLTAAQSLRMAVTARLTAVNNALNASLLANQYVFATVAIVGLTAATWALYDGTSAYEKATKKLAEENKKLSERTDELANATSRLTSILNNNTETRFAQLRAFAELQSLYPSLLKNMSIEEFQALSTADAQRALNEARDQRQVSDKSAQLDREIKALDDLKKEYEAVQSATASFGANGSLQLQQIAGRIEVATEKVQILKGEIDDLKQAQWEANASPEELISHYEKALDGLKKQREESEKLIGASNKVNEAWRLLDFSPQIMGLNIINAKIDEMEGKLRGLRGEQFESTQNKYYWEKIKKNAEEALENMTPDQKGNEAWNKQLKILNNAKKTLETWDFSNKKAGRAANKLLEDRRKFLEELEKAEQESFRNGMIRRDAEIQAEKDKYAAMRKEAVRLGIDPKDISRITDLQNISVSRLQYGQETEVLSKQLDRQKKMWEDYYEALDSIGVEYANKRYKLDFDLDRNLQDAIAPLMQKKLDGTLTQQEEDRLKRFVELQSEFGEMMEQRDRERYQDAYQAALTHSQRLEQIEREYQERIKALGDGASKDQIDQLNRTRKEAIDSASEEAVKKLDIFKKLYEDIDYMSTQSAREVIRVAENELNRLEKLGEKNGGISANAAKRIRRELTGISDAIDNRLPDNLNDISGNLRKIADEVGVINSGFGQTIASVASIAGGMGSILSAINQIKIAQSKGGLDKILGLSTGGAAIFGTLLGIGGAISNAFNASRERRNQELQEQITRSNELQLKQTEAITKLMQRQLELVNEIYGADRLTKYAESLTTIRKNFSDINAELAGRFQLTGDTFIDSILTRLNNGETRKQIKNSFASFSTEWAIVVELFKRIDKGLYNTFSSIPDSIESAREKLQELQYLADRGLADANTQSLIDQLQTQIDLYNDTLNKLKVETVGSSFDQILNDTIALFRNEGIDSAKAWSEGFDKIIEDYLIQRFSRDYLQKAMQEWYDSFDELAKDGLTESEKEQLRKERDLIRQEGDKRLQELKDTLGIDKPLGSGNESGLAGTIGRSITEDTANKWMGVQLNIYSINKNLLAEAQTQTKIMQSHIGFAQRNLDAALNIERNTAGTWDEMKNAVGYLITIAKNTQPGKTGRDLG